MSKRKIQSKTDTSENPPRKSRPGGHWSLGLLGSLEDPAMLVKSDDLVTVIRDKYPKAQFHYLVISKENITSIKALTSNHVALLKHMEKVGLDLIKEKNHAGNTFNLGYHAQPSMTRLHLHVISDDMNSECLKTKRHWNSFTSKFFLKSEDVIRDLEENGTVSLLTNVQCKELMDLPLQCHKCEFKPKNMPDLKKHILRHCKT